MSKNIKSIEDIADYKNLILDSNICCIYHHVDFDGICSAAIVYKFIDSIISKNVGNKSSKVKYIGYNYGMPDPEIDDIENTVVICCDVFIPTLKEVSEKSKQTIWIDHHASSIKDMQDYENEKLIKMLDTNYAACMGVWKFFFPNDDAPRSVKFLSAYDSHMFDDDTLNATEREIFEFQYGLKNVNNNEFTGKYWQDILSSDKNIKEILDTGKIIYNYIEKHNSVELMNRASYTKELKTPDGQTYRALILNAPYTFSKTFDSRYDKNKHDILICFYKNSNQKFQYSFYCPDDKKIDCSLIAKQYGGGGHPGAAGCIVDEILI